VIAFNSMCTVFRDTLMHTFIKVIVSGGKDMIMVRNIQWSETVKYDAEHSVSGGYSNRRVFCVINGCLVDFGGIHLSKESSLLAVR